MSTKSFKVLKNLTATELKSKLRDTQEELFRLRLQHTTGQLEKTAVLWKTRKDIARVKTLMAQAGSKTGSVQSGKQQSKPQSKQG